MLNTGIKKPVRVLRQELNTLWVIRFYSSPLNSLHKAFTQHVLYVNILVTGPELWGLACPSAPILALRWHIARKSETVLVQMAPHGASIRGFFPCCQAAVSMLQTPWGWLGKAGSPMATSLLYAAVNFTFYLLSCVGATPAAPPLFRDSPASFFSVTEIRPTVPRAPSLSHMDSRDFSHHRYSRWSSFSP